MNTTLKQIEEHLKAKLDDPGNVFEALQLLAYFKLLLTANLDQARLYDKSFLWRDVFFRDLLLKPKLRPFHRNHHTYPLSEVKISLDVGITLLRLYWLSIGLKRPQCRKLVDSRVIDCPRRTIEEKLTKAARNIGCNLTISEIKTLAPPQETNMKNWNNDRETMKALLARWPAEKSIKSQKVEND